MTYLQIVKHLREQQKKYLAELNNKNLPKSTLQYLQEKLDAVNKVLEPFNKGDL